MYCIGSLHTLSSYTESLVPHSTIYTHVILPCIVYSLKNPRYLPIRDARFAFSGDSVDTPGRSGIFSPHSYQV